MNFFCTLFDKNYLTRGLVLYDSLVVYCRPFKIWILCMDQETHRILAKLKLQYAILIKLDDFENAGLKKARKNRTHQEYCWTCASSLLWHLFRKHPSLKLLSYLDSDLVFYSNPAPIWEEMGKNSVLIVPHRFAADKTKLVVNGIYNVSLITFRNDSEGKKCLRWWKDQCLAWCYYRVEEGKLGDQKYLDEFPKLFKKVKTLTNIGTGLAHWNIDQYHVWKEGKIIYVDGHPLIFFHFQGIKIPAPFFLASKSVPGPYSFKSSYWTLLYKPYIDKIYQKTNEIQKNLPGFMGGLVPVVKKNYYLFLIAGSPLMFVKKKLGKYFGKTTEPIYDFLRQQRRIGLYLGIFLNRIDGIGLLLNKQLLYFRALKTYFLQDECTRFRDCLLLWKLKYQQPPGSDRYIEYPWAIKELGKLKSGKVLDVGSSSTVMWANFFPDQFSFYGVDINTVSPNKKVKFYQSDIRNTPFRSNFFDAVICVSTLEHIGVVGRYHSNDDPLGDKKAMEEITRITKKGGRLFLTIPFGRADVLPINKLYTRSRLLPMLSGWKIITQEYFKFNTQFGYWIPVSADVAETTDMLTDRWYAIALIVAQKK